MTGQYLSTDFRAGKAAPDGGKYPDKYEVGLLAGNNVIRVAFRDDPALEVERMALITLPVYVRAAKGFVFYDYRASRE